jgi:O-antigen/teichoic acid export membrane protein
MLGNARQKGRTMHDVVVVRRQVARLARSSAKALAVYGAGIGLAYCSQLTIARIVGAETYGIYTYVIAWITVLSYLCASGFDVALLRFVPTYHADRAWELLKGAMQYAERLAIFVSIVTIIISILILSIWAHSLPRQLNETFFIGFALVPVWALLWIRCSAARAFGAVVLAVAPDRVMRDGALIVLIAFAYFCLGWKIDAPLAMSSTLIGSIVGLAVVSVTLRQLRPRELETAVPVYAAAAWQRTALPLMIMGATEVFMNRTGILLLGWIGEANNAGIYSLAFNIAFVVTLPRTAINTLFTPTVSALFSHSERSVLQVLIAKSSWWMLVAATCAGTVLLALAEPVLGWFGADYRAGVPALQILLIGQMITAGAGSQMQVMTMTGHERIAAGLLVLMSGVHLVMSLGLIRSFGLTGAAIATCTTLILWNLAMAFYIWRRVHVLPGVLGIFCSSI